MSRTRKAQVNDVVIFWTDGSLLPKLGVVVDYRTDVKWGRYRVVKIDSRGRPFGSARWVESTDLRPQGRTSIRPAIVYRANRKSTDRGCVCQCCNHVRGFEDETD